ncbi:MAG: FliM/FliN family flagellar motor switch protein [Cocleimonas sp.]|nr:FliM/FliN family flagellar motor switch protein [Cocleimonas sp.]
MIVQKKNYKEIKLHRYSSDELVRWKNLIAPKTQYIEFSLNDDSFSYQVFIRNKLPNINDRSIGLLVEIEGVPAALWLSSWPLIDRIRGYITENKLKKLPLELRAELLETALEPLLTAIVSRLKISLNVLNFFKIEPNDINDYAVAFKVTENQSRKIDAVLIMNKKLQPVVEKLIKRWPSFLYEPEWNNHLSSLYFEVGLMTLTVTELSGVSVADVLLIEAENNIKNNNLFVRLASNVRFRARLTNEILTLESGAEKMSENEREDNIAQIGEIPVTLTFDVGEMVLPFHEVECLTSGYVINLNKPFTEVVRIRSQNRVLGTGELVDINGKIGVRVIELFGINTNG